MASRRRVRSLHVHPFELETPHLHPRHEGLVLAHLTDLHFRGRRPHRRVLHAVEQAARAAPDAVLLTGDYVCWSAVDLRALRAGLRDLPGPAFATLGNHDHWTDAPRIALALTELGITVLANSHATLLVRGAPLHLVGLDDQVTGHADPALAFAQVPAGGTTLVLSHDPKAAELLAGYRAALVLSGHTHGGQIRIPGLTERLARRVGIPYLAGHYRVHGNPLYVSRGLGHSLPLRVGARSELPLITLRPVATVGVALRSA